MNIAEFMSVSRKINSVAAIQGNFDFQNLKITKFL